MKILSISDLHIITPGDEAHQFFKKFVQIALNSDANIIVFLGDIFDFMVGSQTGYLDEYDWYFDSIKELLKNGKIIYFFEGNHDFHLDQIFRNYLEKLQLNENFFYMKETKVFEVGTKKIAFMHGDDLDLDNTAYQRWKKIYSSTPFKFLVSNVLPYKALKLLGSKASEDSKKRGRPIFDFEKFKNKYRQKAKNYFEMNSSLNVLVAGHTHIKDEYSFNEKVYVNAGYPKQDNSYIQITEESIEVLEI